MENVKKLHYGFDGPGFDGTPPQIATTVPQIAISASYPQVMVIYMFSKLSTTD